VAATPHSFHTCDMEQPYRIAYYRGHILETFRSSYSFFSDNAHILLNAEACDKNIIESNQQIQNPDAQVYVFTWFILAAHIAGNSYSRRM
jgi:hypothetical protein